MTLLQELIDATPSGGVLTVPPGIYRETLRLTRPIILDGRGQASIRGSDAWSDWTRQGDSFVSRQTVPHLSVNNQGFCLLESPDCNVAEQVFVDGTPTPFRLDAERHVLLQADPHGKAVEVSTRERWIDTQADNVTIQGLTFWHCANAAETGAVGNQSRSNWTIRDCELYSAHGGIVSLGGGDECQVLYCRIAGSGYEAINGFQNRHTLIQGCEIWDNNLAGFDWVNWAGAGIKLIEFTHLTMDSNTVYRNVGPGLWCDIGCDHVVISNNTIYDNVGAQIMFEISSHGLIYNNHCSRGGSKEIPSIYVSSSGHVEVAHNLIDEAGRGIQVYEQPRNDRMPDAGTHTLVHDNTILLADSDSVGMLWDDDVNDHIIDPASLNNGWSNDFGYDAPEGPHRFTWGRGISHIDEFSETPGGRNSNYV